MKAELIILSISIILLALICVSQEIRLARIEKRINQYRIRFGGDR